MYRKYIHLTRVQIEDAIDKADLQLHDARCNPANERSLQRLETKIKALYEALRYKDLETKINALYEALETKG
jgi:hypothetical protein